MIPHQLIGKPYRLGSNFEQHGTGDCLSLARAVLAYYGITTPEPQRQWYRRLRQGDTAVFEEELERWGIKTSVLDCGVVALCQADAGYGLATWYLDGWIHYAESVVKWSTSEALQVHALYCQRK